MNCSINIALLAYFFKNTGIFPVFHSEMDESGILLVHDFVRRVQLFFSFFQAIYECVEREFGIRGVPVYGQVRKLSTGQSPARDIDCWLESAP